MTGKLITLEGPDGAGKTTVIAPLKQMIEDKGYTVITTREPGGTELGEKIRELLLHFRMTDKAELLLFAAARAEHLKVKILPAIEAGNIVICDRFADSTYAYQGEARGHIAKVLQLEEFVLEGFEPHHTLFFNITLEESQRRLNLRSGKLDNFDLMALEFKKAVHKGYMHRFATHYNRMIEINAMQSPDEVLQQMQVWVDKTFQKKQA